jgi:hypothetical protein
LVVAANFLALNTKGVYMKYFCMKSILFFVIGVLVTNAQAQTRATTVTAAELAMHRLEKLVSLKKVEVDFQTKIKGLVLTNYNPGNTTSPSFKAVAYQYPAADGKAKTLEILQDSTAKALSFNVVTAGPATGYPTWPGKDPVSLIETALHFIEDHADEVVALVPYRDGLRSFSIAPAKDGNGKDVALIAITIDASVKILKVLVNLDGKFNAYVVE